MFPKINSARQRLRYSLHIYESVQIYEYLTWPYPLLVLNSQARRPACSGVLQGVQGIWGQISPPACNAVFFYVTFVDIFHIIVLIYPIHGDYVNDIFYTKCFVKNEEIQLHNQPIKQLPSAKWCPLRYARLSRHMSAWRHHDMWTVSTLLALCGGMHQSSMDQIKWSFILSLI